MIIKAVNNTTCFDGLILTLPVFRAYLCIHNMDLPVLIMIQKAAIIKKAIKQVRKIRAKNQVIDAFNIKNALLVNLVCDLSPNFDVLVWQKSYVREIGQWMGSFKP